MNIRNANRNIVLFFVFCALSSASIAHAGNFVGNGGDASAMEFTWMARIATRRLETAKLSPDQKLHLTRLKDAIDHTRVVCKTKLHLDGEQVDAINYPDKRLIVIRRAGWAQMKRNTSTTRFGFVLHEYLGVSAVGDPHYETSKALVETMIDERASDVQAQEHVLDSLLSLKMNLADTYETVNRNAAAGKGFDPRRVCFMAGFMNGQTSVLSLVISNPRPWFVQGDPDKDFIALEDVTIEMKTACGAGIANVGKLRNLISSAMSTVDRLSGSLLPKFDLSKPLLIRPLQNNVFVEKTL